MIFDAHSDIWSDVTARRLRGETDILRKHHLPRLRKGDVEGSVFVIWVEPAFTNDYMKRTQEHLSCIREEIAQCDEIRIVHTCAEMRKAKADGKFYIFIGAEGMAAIGDDISNLDMYYDFGVRHAMLTWNEENTLATGALANPDRGVTDLGRQVIRKMQEKKILMDVSHLNEKSFWDVVKISDSPISASHSNAKALCNVPRNLTDDQLRAMRDLDGVVGLNAFNLFVDPEPAKQTVANLAKHAAYMADVMGIEHVGCGLDFFEFIDQSSKDTMSNLDSTAVIGMDDSSQIGALFMELEKLGMTAVERDLIAYGNYHRVMEKVIG